MFKKLLAWIILAVYLLVMAAPAAAQDETGKISQEQAMEIAQKAFGFKLDTRNMQVGYREDEYVGKKIWELSWNLGRYNYWRDIRAEVDADTGEIITFWDNESFGDPNKRPKQTKKTTREQALATAKAIAAKLQPQRFGQTELSQEEQPDYNIYYGPQQYGFNFVRQVNGIPFQENAIRVTINAETGKVTNYTFMWNDDLNFPAADKIISKEEAEKLFRDKIGLSLRYVRSYGPFPMPAGKEVPLYYTSSESLYGGSGVLIDALSGRIVDFSGKEKAETKVVEKVYQPAKDNTDEAAQADNQKSVTMEEPKKLAREVAAVPSDFILQNSSYRSGWGPGNAKVYEFQFGSKDRSGPPVSIGIDAATGELIHFNKFDESRYGKTGEIKFNFDRCRQIALDFVKKAAPGKMPELQLQEITQPQYDYMNGKRVTPPYYYFNFVRLANGIPYDQNNISVAVDNNTGEINNYYMNWDKKVKFAASEGVISEEEALNNLLKESPIHLTYLRKASNEGVPGKEVMLVYTVFGESQKMVNATTGKVDSWWKLENPTVPFEDVSRHWAEREIKLLYAAGVVSGSGKTFNPNKAVSRAEFVTILAKAKGLEISRPDKVTFTDISAGDWFAGAVEAAAKAGWIKGDKGKFYPNRPVTRQEMAVMVAKAMDTQLPGDFELDFKDKKEIAPWALDAVKLSVEMGLLSGRDGKFAPRANATKAEAAVYLFKVMERGNSYGYGWG